jgi:hypothetical protein
MKPHFGAASFFLELHDKSGRTLFVQFIEMFWHFFKDILLSVYDF